MEVKIFDLIILLWQNLKHQGDKRNVGHNKILPIYTISCPIYITPDDPSNRNKGRGKFLIILLIFSQIYTKISIHFKNFLKTWLKTGNYKSILSEKFWILPNSIQNHQHKPWTTIGIDSPRIGSFAGIKYEVKNCFSLWDAREYRHNFCRASRTNMGRPGKNFNFKSQTNAFILRSIESFCS